MNTTSPAWAGSSSADSSGYWRGSRMWPSSLTWGNGSLTPGRTRNAPPSTGASVIWTRTVMTVWRGGGEEGENLGKEENGFIFFFFSLTLLWCNFTLSPTHPALGSLRRRLRREHVHT